MRKSAVLRMLTVFFVAAALLSGQAALGQGNDPYAMPWFDPATGILNIPYITTVEGGVTPSFTAIQVRLTAPQVLAATPVGEFFSDQKVMGGLAYSKYWVTTAGGTGTEPSHADFTRCKACHGWDLLGTAGGYVRRGDGGGTRSAGVAIRVDRTDYTSSQILNGSWNPGVDTPTQSHPNFNGILTTPQVNALLAYLNSRDGKFVPTIGYVYNAPNPVQYYIPFGDATRGQSFYQTNCQGCHGAPEEDSADFPAGGPEGGLLAFFVRDGKPSEMAHKTTWGEAGSFMTRAAMGNPTSQDVADIVKYFQSLPK